MSQQSVTYEDLKKDSKIYIIVKESKQGDMFFFFAY